MPTATVFDSSIAEGNPISRSAGHKIFFALLEEFPVKQKRRFDFVSSDCLFALTEK